MLAIVGGPSGTAQGGEVARLMELAAALGVSERVMLFPPLPQARLADLYAAADVVLVPSRSESFGLVALESQACGTPVVAAAVGGLRFVVHDDRTGFLVEGHDPADHADRMLQILRDPALAERLGVSAARESLRFTWDATAAELAGIYRELLTAGRSSRAITSRSVRSRNATTRSSTPGRTIPRSGGSWTTSRRSPWPTSPRARSAPPRRGSRSSSRPRAARSAGIGINNVRRRDRICALYVFIGERSAWGKGLGTTRSTRCWRHAFSRLDLHQVELWSLADNERALRAYAHSGFREEARLAERSWKDGRWVDRVLMSVTRENFDAARMAREQHER